MKYYIQEVYKAKTDQKTAGIKARDDVEEILESLSYRPIVISSIIKDRKDLKKLKKVLIHKETYDIWKKTLSFLKSEDELIVQFPIKEHSIFLSHLFKIIQNRNIKVSLIIHDLELLRTAKRQSISRSQRLRLKIEEENMLKICSKIIVHNEKMKNFVSSLGIDKNKLISLEIFDYLIDDLKKEQLKKNQKDLPIIIAGNLRIHKAKYAYHLPDNYNFNLYGVDYEGVINDKIKYHGSFSPNALPYAMEGSFGLVWDGESATTCNGVYGEYLKINNPHKTSLYLSLGIPVIIWKQAALADFICENKCGIVIDSLYDIKDKLDKMTEKEYNELLENTQKVSEKLLNGYYTKKAIALTLK